MNNRSTNFQQIKKPSKETNKHTDGGGEYDTRQKIPTKTGGQSATAALIDSKRKQRKTDVKIKENDQVKCHVSRKSTRAVQQTTPIGQNRTVTCHGRQK